MNNKIETKSFLQKTDTELIGFIAGLIIPMFMLAILYLLKFKGLGYDWNGFIGNVKQPSILPTFIRNCVFLNLPFFFIFNLLKLFNVCKGIFIASLLYIVAMLVVRYIL